MLLLLSSEMLYMLKDYRITLQFEKFILKIAGSLLIIPRVRVLNNPNLITITAENLCNLVGMLMELTLSLFLMAFYLPLT